MSTMQPPALTTLNIATRQSPLALWQAEHIRDRLLALYPELTINLLKIVTKGDKILDTPLAKIGGKGLFVKELEQALYDKQADIAVHSLKDVPMELPEGLTLGVYCKRASPTDAFVSNTYHSIDELPQGAVVGTASLRRQCQIKAYRPDLQIKTLRGNVGTRLGKLDAGEYDAIILAAAGLERLGLQQHIRQQFATEQMLPAAAQGVIGIECLAGRADLRGVLAELEHAETARTTAAERAVALTLQANCQSPVATYATIAEDRLRLTALVALPDGSRSLRDSLEGPARDAEEIGRKLAASLLDKGAGELLEQAAADG